MAREAGLIRRTGETRIEINVLIDGEGSFSGSSGIGFFDHMLSLLARHGLMDISLSAEGDIGVDSHHTVEDIGIVLGACIGNALGDKRGIKRYGSSFVPMDETLASVHVDISGRPILHFEGSFTVDRLGGLDTEMIEEFFRAFAVNAGITLHASILYGRNNHHMAEGLFKALGRALREAVEYDGRIKGVMSTKGVI